MHIRFVSDFKIVLNDYNNYTTLHETLRDVPPIFTVHYKSKAGKKIMKENCAGCLH